MTDKPLLLVVEDSPEDYEALRRAFKKAGVTVPLMHCGTGDDALDYLARCTSGDSRVSNPRPRMVLLDLNLPGTDGREVLRSTKKNPETASIPVVVFTTSSDPVDVAQCYASGANGYVQKPVDMAELTETVSRIAAFWFETVILPADRS